MSETIFSKIVRKEIPADIVYEDEQCLAFRDVHPQAPTHILVIPKKQIVNLSDTKPEDKDVLGAMLLAVGAIAKKFNLSESGYRVVVNNGEGAGQSVFHMHFHILSGRPFAWPPG